MSHHTDPSGTPYYGGTGFGAAVTSGGVHGTIGSGGYFTPNKP